MTTQINHRASPISPEEGAIRHVRRNVLLLLGFYNTQLHTGIARYAREAGWALEESYSKVGMAPVWWRGDGILSLITNPKDVRALEVFPKLPQVDLSKGWISSSMPPEDRQCGVDVPRVLYDNTEIGRLAAEHFLNRGFRHVAYLNMGNYWLETDRIPVIRNTLTAAGATFHEIELYKQTASEDRESGSRVQANHRWLTDLVRDLPKPLGIILTSDNVAPRLMHACDDAGVFIPEEVGILGCDNDPMICDYTPVPLSSVDCDWDRIGYEAARLLDRIMDGGTPPERELMVPPKGVVTRLSTNILAVPDPQIAKGLRFIWENYAKSVGTAEVAQAAGLNRRTLERGFRQHFGRSVGEEIMRVRINCAKTLLAETQRKAHEIAELSGFSGMVPFSKAFLRETGLRPSTFRKGARH